MDRKKEQIQERQESGKGILCRRSQADSVIRLERKVFANSVIAVCAAPSHVYFVKTPELKRHCFYKESSGYFIFFPASGNRNNSDGKLYNSGTNGYGWTSTPNGSSNAYYLYFNSGDAYVNNNNRTNGRSVRCVQASATVFVLFFPASGNRLYADGSMAYAGTWGHGWTASPLDGSNAWFFRSSSGIVHVYSGNRNHGFSVRCVQASATVWIYLEKGLKQIRYRRESGKAHLCRRGRADSVTRLERKAFACERFISCVAPSHLTRLIKVPVFNRLYFYKHSSGYFLFFPAAGIRNYTDGSLRNSGGEGDGWTSTPYNSENAYRFILNSGNANMSNTNRTYGFAVRCVQASASVFAFTKDTIVFFPASGCRLYSDGCIQYSGTSAIVWSGTPNDVRAWYLDANAPGAHMQHNFRTYGFAVRCVQASASVFAFTKDMFCFFPASGIRSRSAGNIADLGMRGLLWTATPEDSKSALVSVGSGNVSVYSDDCKYGLAVRCVQASATVWIYLEKGLKQIWYRRESGKARLCRRGRADSVTRLGCKLSANENRFVCAAPSYSISLIKLPVLQCLYFYKHSSGYFFFFPASGYRNNSTGSISNPGVRGYGWTSVPYNSSSSWYMVFHSTNAAMSTNPSRADGLTVRCVQASASVFAFIKDTFCFFPASGYRIGGDGKLGDSGTSGHGWASSPSGSNAYYFRFVPSIAQVNTTIRGAGFSVRCVQASATVFVCMVLLIKNKYYGK